MGNFSTSVPTAPTVVDPAKGSYLAKVDQAFDIVPVVAAVNNSVDLVFKGIFLVTPQWLIDSTYYTKYIDEKRWTTCLGCSIGGFIFTSFFENQASSNTYDRKGSSEEHRPLIVATDLSILENAVTSFANDIEISESLRQVREELLGATFESFVKAKRFIEAALEKAVNNEALSELSVVVDGKLREAIELRGGEADQLITQARMHKQKMDCTSYAFAAQLLENAATRVNVTNPAKAQLTLEERDETLRELAEIKIREEINEAKELLNAKSYDKSIDSFRAVLEKLGNTGTVNTIKDEIEKQIEKADSLNIMTKMEMYIEMGDDHFEGEDKSEVDALKSAVSFYREAINLSEKLPEAYKAQFAAVCRKAEIKLERATKAYNNEQSKAGNALYLEARKFENENDIAGAIENYRSAIAFLEMPDPGLAEIARDRIKKLEGEQNDLILYGDESKDNSEVRIGNISLYEDMRSPRSSTVDEGTSAVGLKGSATPLIPVQPEPKPAEVVTKKLGFFEKLFGKKE